MIYLFLITANSAKTACACPRGLKLDKDDHNCIQDGKKFYTWSKKEKYFLKKELVGLWNFWILKEF